MAKSKLVNANKKIADTVVKGYEKIENTIVDKYKSIEDKFVDQYLTKDGETIEEAKKRLKKEQQMRNNKVKGGRLWKKKLY